MVGFLTSWFGLNVLVTECKTAQFFAFSFVTLLHVLKFNRCVNRFQRVTSFTEFLYMEYVLCWDGLNKYMCEQ